jgi:UDPglucose--hexose-1-phosphate uridylyltransferase
LNDVAHRRFNPLLHEWVLVSPERLARPWQGRREPSTPVTSRAYDAACYLCPGNTRANGVCNPAYTTTFTFDNDYPALRPTAPRAEHEGLLVADAEPGICRVISYSPRHDMSIAAMSLQEIEPIVDVWIDEFATLGAKPWIHYVQIFENRGASMGASNPHPHGQIWATAAVPNIPAREQASFLAHRDKTGTCLLCEYLAVEARRAERFVLGNDHFSLVVPFWAVWPYETLLMPARHVSSLDELVVEERQALASVLKRLTGAYDRLFDAPCAYSMGFHQRPTDGAAHPEWHLHAHFLPPALRSATVHKFLVGFELLGMPQRDLTPETAAATLRAAAES